MGTFDATPAIFSVIFKTLESARGYWIWFNGINGGFYEGQFNSLQGH